ncbi:Cytochrome c oxidase subunit 3 [Capsicum chinense]|nr:Cytochrome c oxidase subunit 3 [Capsicum chinense]
MQWNIIKHPSLFFQYLGHLTKEHHVGFEAAAWYWNFVDVVRLFLVVSIYWWELSDLSQEKERSTLARKFSEVWYSTAHGKSQSERSNDTIDPQEIAKYINSLSLSLAEREGMHSRHAGILFKRIGSAFVSILIEKREGKITADWLASEAPKQPSGYQQLLTYLPGHKIPKNKKEKENIIVNGMRNGLTLQIIV